MAVLAKWTQGVEFECLVFEYPFVVVSTATIFK